MQNFRTFIEEKESLSEKVSAIEDLMREHGILNRILLVYEEGIRRLKSGEEVSPDVFNSSAKLIRNFIEDYHEKLEEDYIFPKIKKNLLSVVNTLIVQHKAGRKLTDQIIENSNKNKFLKNRKSIIDSVESFVKMYRPHESREDTVVFPALYDVMSVREIKDLGEQFEKREQKLFGKNDIKHILNQIEKMEKDLEIYDLNVFTPK